MVESSLGMTGGPQPFTLIVKPWEDTFTVNPQDVFVLVALHPCGATEFSVEWWADALLVSPPLDETTYRLLKWSG